MKIQPFSEGAHGTSPGSSSGISRRGWASLLALGVVSAVLILGVLNASSDMIRWEALGAISLVALGCAVYATIVDQKWLVIALVLEETLPYLNILPFDKESGRWFLRLPLLLAFAIPATISAWKSGILGQGAFRLFLIYFAWAAISLIYSLKPGISAGRLFADSLEFLVLVAVVADIKDPQDMDKVLGRLVAACAILAFLNLLALFAFPSSLTWVDDESGVLRFSGITTTPNAMGGMMRATIGAGLVFWAASSGRRRAFVALVMVLSIVFAALADSRSTFIALTLGCAAYLVWRYRFKGMAGILLLAVIAVAFYGTISVSNKAYFNRDVTTLTGRTYAWEFELQKIRERPLLGYGYDIEGEIFQDRYFQEWSTFWDQGVNTSTHNSYLSVAVGLGIPALLFWLYIFLKPWIWIFRGNDDEGWRLKQLFFFVGLPAIIMGFDETGLAQPRYADGVVLFLCWMIVERRRLLAQAEVLLDAHSVRPLFAASARIAGALLLSSVLLFPARSWASDYYVDAVQGRDANSGLNPSTPWKTLNKINHFQFRPGDIVHLARGSTWRETLQPQGREDANFRGVTITSYGTGNLPTINGADEVSNWTPAGSGIYSARMDKKVYNLFVNQAPGWGLFQACCLPGSNCAPSPRTNPVHGESCAIGPMRAGSWYWSGAAPSGGGLANTLYVWLPDGSAPTGRLIEAVVRPMDVLTWVPKDQLDNFKLDGLRLIQAGLRAISLQSGDRAGCCGSRGVASGRGISGLAVRNCIVERTGTGMFDEGSYGNAITIINATAPLVENNRVSFSGDHGNCINVQNSNGARVLNNMVDHWNHNGIDIKGSRDVLVDGNSARDQPAFGAGFYAEYCENVTFSHNRVYNVSNGFQIALESSATIIDNYIQSAATGVFFGPRSIALKLERNTMNSCSIAFEGDGSGSLQQDNNSWGTNPRFMVHGREVSLNAWKGGGF